MVKRLLDTWRTLRLKKWVAPQWVVQEEVKALEKGIIRALENPEEIFEIEIDWKIVKVQRLKVDSSNWKTINFEWKQLKISPTWWIVEFEWEQYFDLTVAKKAIKMDYKYIPNGEILEKLMEKLLLIESFKNRIPGIIETKNKQLIWKWETIIFWSSSLENGRMQGYVYVKWSDEIKKSFFNPWEFLFPFLTIE